GVSPCESSTPSGSQFEEARSSERAFSFLFSVQNLTMFLYIIVLDSNIEYALIVTCIHCKAGSKKPADAGLSH
ncbi:hypothetical protein Q4520_19940, partial [Alteromonas sp. 1_MG-2023]|uniref:hypothetical protein n=1 Tax=Alteromonas sp. 1_MG-2023 TaxID=3062669 RepID=UPI0026E4057A